MALPKKDIRNIKKIIVFDVDKTLIFYNSNTYIRERPYLDDILNLIRLNQLNPEIDFFLYTNGDTWRDVEKLTSLFDDDRVFGLGNKICRTLTKTCIRPSKKGYWVHPHDIKYTTCIIKSCKQ